MIFYVLRRLIAGLVLAVLVTFLTFSMLSLSFDGVVTTILGPSTTPEAVVALRAELGYDRPLIVQYLEWLSNAVQGNFGSSVYTSEPVAPAVASRLAVTLSIVVIALLITVVISVALGVLSATRGGTIDRIAQGLSLTGHLVPGLLIAIVLVLVFAIGLRLLPATGYTPPDVNLSRWAATITIPVIVLVINGIANVTAQVRGAMIGELHKDYVRTLRTRGISTWSIVIRHALRNSAGPALTVLSLEFLTMLGGALIIEKVFALPGFGIYSFNAALQGDIPIILGITTFSVLLVVIVNVTVDLVNGWLNPKARIA